jgi:hypothetical protein
MAFLDTVGPASPERINSANILKSDMADLTHRAGLVQHSEDKRREIIVGQNQCEDSNHDHEYCSKNARTVVSDGVRKPQSGPDMRSASAAESSSTETSLEPRKMKMG